MKNVLPEPAPVVLAAVDVDEGSDCRIAARLEEPDWSACISVARNEAGLAGAPACPVCDVAFAAQGLLALSVWNCCSADCAVEISPDCTAFISDVRSLFSVLA